MSSEGNVLNAPWNVDNTGATDASSGLNAAFASNYANNIPAGDYLLNSPLVIPRAKTIVCENGSLITGYVHPGDESVAGVFDYADAEIQKSTGEQARFIINGDFHAVEFQKQEIHWYGGCFDFQGVSINDKAAFYLPGNWTADNPSNRAAGWGATMDNFVVLGPANRLRDQALSSPNSVGVGGGTKAVFMDLNGQTVNNGYFSRVNVNGRVRGCDYGLYTTKRNGSNSPPYNHWSNTHVIRLDCADTRTPVHDESGRTCEYHITHTAGPVFPSQAVANSTPSVYSHILGDTDNLYNQFENQFFDFETADVGGYAYNRKTYDIGDNYVLTRAKTEDVDRSIARGFPELINIYNAHRSIGANVNIRISNQADLEDAASDVNTVHKARGTMVLDETSGIVLRANGQQVTDTWLNCSTATTVYTPS